MLHYRLDRHKKPEIRSNSTGNGRISGKSLRLSLNTRENRNYLPVKLLDDGDYPPKYNSNIKKMDGEIYRYGCCPSKNKKLNILVTNRRIMYLKEVEILGHKTLEWNYTFEDLLNPPTVEDNVLTLSVKDQSIFHKKEHGNHELKRRIPFENHAKAQETLNALDEARTTHCQQTLVRQKSERFIKQYSN